MFKLHIGPLKLIRTDKFINDEITPWFQTALHLFHIVFQVFDMVYGLRGEGRIKGLRLKLQLVEVGHRVVDRL